jgi:predicted DsbA family dithiol-disulfide isomerase
MAEHVRGHPGAPVTVVEYGDYECPYCAAAAPVLRTLVEESGGRVRLVFRNFPLADTHAYALTAALAAEAAGAQGAFWPMHDLLFERQDRLTDVALRAYADQLGLDGERVVGAAAQPYGDKVEADFAAGLAAGVAGTPTIFVNDRLYSGRVELGALRRAVASADGASSVDGGLHPRPRRQRRWPLGVRRAEGEALAENPQEDDAGEGRGHRPGEDADGGLVAQCTLGERQIGDEQRDGEADARQGRPRDEVRPPHAAG